MGEAIIAKYSPVINQETLDTIEFAGLSTSSIAHLALVKVTDSGGNALPNIPVNCKDGSKWYNYTTNDKGKVIFSTNSGNPSITAQNYSVVDGVTYIDQLPTTMNYDAAVGTKSAITLSLKKQNGVFTINTNQNIKFADTNSIKVELVGGGAGGAGGVNVVNIGISNLNTYAQSADGGGGGAYNTSNISIDRGSVYPIIIGSGGIGGTTYIHGTWSLGNSGGTTSAFGLSAAGGYGKNGGGSGDFKGGDGGKFYYAVSPNVSNANKFNISSNSTLANMSGKRPNYHSYLDAKTGLFGGGGGCGEVVGLNWQGYITYHYGNGFGQYGGGGRILVWVYNEKGMNMLNNTSKFMYYNNGEGKYALVDVCKDAPGYGGGGAGGYSPSIHHHEWTSTSYVYNNAGNGFKGMVRITIP